MAVADENLWFGPKLPPGLPGGLSHHIFRIAIDGNSFTSTSRLCQAGSGTHDYANKLSVESIFFKSKI